MEWNDFLNPRSMLTPGVAGSLVMVIANTLWVEFMIPQKWSALTLSFLLIIPILARYACTFYENVIYFVFNGLIIFALSANSNFAGVKIQEITNQSKQNLLSRLSFSNSNANTASEINKKQQLALNDQASVTTILAAQQTDDEKNETNSKDKNDNEKKKDKQKQNDKDRQFFESWF